MKLFKSINYFILCFFIIILEMTLGKYIAVSGTVPMLSFCLCLVIASKEKSPDYIIYIGIITGVFLDLLIGHGFGTYTVIFSLCVWITYLLRDSIFSSMLVFLIIDTAILTILSSIVYFLLHILNVGITFGTMITRIALPSALYNAIIVAVFYAILSFTMYRRR